MKLLLFGGTFDPVHNGHVAMARAAREELAVSELIVLPAGNPYQRGRPPCASAEARLAMLRLAFGDEAAIDTRELERQGPTYTFDTLRELRGERPDAEFFWLIGSDAFAKLATWHRVAELLALTRFAVAARAGDAVQAPAGLSGVRYRVLKVEPPPVSSTAVRARIAAGGTLRGMAPDAVCDYIERYQPYQTLENPR